jgi:hypothetical protein
MNSMQKSLTWIADHCVKNGHDDPRPSDCVTAVDMVAKSVLFRATLEDQRIATRELLRRHGY